MESHAANAWVRALATSVVPAARVEEVLTAFERDESGRLVWWVAARPPLYGMLVGRDGITADQVRDLLRCHLRARGHREPFDVHVRTELPPRLTPFR